MQAELFGPRLKELRNKNALSQKQLADKAGLAQSTVADIEQRRYAPTWPTVLALCEALGVDCSAFLQEPTTSEGKQGRGRPSKPETKTASEEPAVKGRKKKKK